MQFPESWLRRFCNPPLNTAELADVLTMAGMEVEDVRPVAPPFQGVVVGHILQALPHPNADRLRVCTVDAGGSAPLQIVCGAPNAREGIKVPLATVGARLPASAAGEAPFEIRVGKLRGVESFGMLCSARELGLSDEHGGLLELPADATVGQDVRQALNLDDTLLTLKLTPNLGHALSVYGIARELAALTGAPLQSPPFEPALATTAERVPVRIEAPDLCGRLTGRVVSGVNPKASTPSWMVERLARCGQRSVTALVDISNYVMFELGRPSHIFDRDRIQGGELIVRWARDGESLPLLNGQTVELDGSVGVIADAAGVESLAGIMGGEASAVSDATQNIYIEAAFWWPEAVMGRSRRFGFSTEAGHRFERGVDAASTREHVERITQLVLEICGGQAGPLDDSVVSLPPVRTIDLRVARASRVIGMTVTMQECEQVLSRLGFAASVAADGVLRVTPPSWRFDVTLEEDLIEEVIRVLGYARLPATPPLAPITPRVASEGRRSLHALRRDLAALDYHETINFSFVEERWERELAGNDTPIRLHNPIAAPLAVMRTSLIGSLVQVLRHNLVRKATRVRVFEIGRVFLRDPAAACGPTQVGGLTQPQRLAALAHGPAEPLQWGERERPVDFFDIKGDLEALFAPLTLRFTAAPHPALHPGRSARVWVGEQAIGWVGELHPRWRQAYELPAAPVLFEVCVDAATARPMPQWQPLPKVQAVQRDVALIVGPEVTHDAVMAALRGSEPLIHDVRLFDVFTPAAGTAGFAPGERSLAVRLVLRDDDQALTDERTDALVAAAVTRAATACAARLRA